MKRRNLFLAVTTGLLAIASFTFAKSRYTSRTNFTGYCCHTNINSGCSSCPTMVGKYRDIDPPQPARCQGTLSVVTQACAHRLNGAD